MQKNLASFALDPANSRGRLFEERATSIRNPFQEDLNRITNSASFRRLEYKTQVFINDKGDHYRTRLTHSIEVSQIGKVLANHFNLSADLTEVICLSHDLGHPPFGHAGEEALDAAMKSNGGFDHNANALRLVVEGEEKYFAYNGLNLTWETLEGMVKHNGPLLGENSKKRPIDKFILEFNDKYNLHLDKFASLEAQVAAISDDIAYNAHDLEDGLKAGLFSLDDIKQNNFMDFVLNDVEKNINNYENRRALHEIIKKLADALILDVISETKNRLLRHNIKSFGDVQNAPENLVSFSEKTSEFILKLKEFLFNNMYRHSQVNRMTFKGRKIVKDLFEVYMNDYGCLPEKWRRKIDQGVDPKRVICDYISGMTDRFAMREHEQLYNF